MSIDNSRMAEHASVSIERAPEWHDGDGILHRYAPDQTLHEPARIRTLVEVRKYWDSPENEVARLLQLGLAAPAPYEIVESEGNLLTTTGTGGAFNAWTGLSTAGLAIPFNTTNAQLVVGDSSTATSAAHTDMQAALATKLNAADATIATNATPIVVTATYSPTPVTGQVVAVSGFTGAGAAAINQTFEITSASASVLTLLNSVGAGAITLAGGVLQPVNKYAMRANGAGSAVITTNSIVYVAVFATINANFHWLEWGLRLGAQITNMQAAPPSSLFNRAIPDLGTKTSSATWTLSVTCTWS
jgi:hypothetical protein